MNPNTRWIVDEQQRSFIATVFDLEVHDPIDLTLSEIDEHASLSIGQNRTEMVLDSDAVEILAMYMADDVMIPMPVVYKPSLKTRCKLIVLDGNHRIAAALRKRGEPSCRALLVTGESQVAQRFAIVANTQHGRSTRDASYVATAMRMLREQGVSIPTIARMFGVSDSKVGVMTRRDTQMDRLRQLVPERRVRVPAHTLDLVGQIEDAHLKVLGELFLDAPKIQQEEIAKRLKDTPSGQRDAVAHEAVGELREIERAKRKVKAAASKPASQLQGALQRLVGVLDPVRAYYASTDQQKAIMRSNLNVVMPRLRTLMTTINEQTSEVA